MARNEPPYEHSNHTQINPQETPLVPFIEEELMTGNPDLQTLLAVESENVAGSSAGYLQYCPPRLQDEEVDRVVQEVVDDLIAEQLLGEPSPKRSRYDDPGVSFIADESKETTSTMAESHADFEATSTGSMTLTPLTDSEPVSLMEDDNCPQPETIVEPRADSNLDIDMKKDSELIVESCNLREATDALQVSTNNDENLATPTELGDQLKNLIIVIEDNSESIETSSNLHKATSDKSTTQVTVAMEVTATNDENRLEHEKTVDRGDQSKIIIINENDPDPKDASGNLLEATSDKSTSLHDDSKQVVSTTDNDRPILETAVDTCSHCNQKIVIEGDSKPKVGNSNLLESTSDESKSNTLSNSESVAAVTDEKCPVPDTIVGTNSDSNPVIVTDDDPEPKEENCHLFEATSEKSRNTTAKTELESLAETNGKHFPVQDTIVGPCADSNPVIVIDENPEPKVENSNLVEVTSDKSRSTSLMSDSKSVASNNDEYCLVSEKTVDQCLKSKHAIDSQLLPRTTAESCISPKNLTAETREVKSHVIKKTVDSSTQVEQTDTEQIIEMITDNRSIFDTAGTSGEHRPSPGARVDASIQSKRPIDVELAPEAHSIKEHNEAIYTSQIQVLQEPKENAANSTNVKEIDKECSEKKNDESVSSLPKCSDPGVEGIGSSTTSPLSSSRSSTTDSASDATDGSQIIKKRKIEMIEDSEKYQDNIFKKPKFLGREEKVPLSELESPSTSGICSSDVSIGEEDRDKENKEVTDMKGSEPKKLEVPVGEGSGQEGPAQDDADEGLGAESDGSSDGSDEGVGFSLRRRPPSPPPAARGTRRSTRIPKYPDRLIYHRKDQF